MEDRMRNHTRLPRRAALLIATAAVLSAVVAQQPAGKWRPARALPRKKGVEPVMVRTRAPKAETIVLEYAIPKPRTKALQTQSGRNAPKRLLLGNAPNTARQGEPLLPVIPSRVIIPKGRVIDRIEVSRGSRNVLPGKHVIEHHQGVYPLIPGVQARPASPKASIYNSDNAYPGAAYELASVQKKRGVHIAFVNLHPVAYHPKSGKLAYYEDIELTIITREDHAASSDNLRPRLDNLDGENLEVENPEALDTYQGSGLQGGTSPLSLCDPALSYQYVLVTSAAIRDASTTPNVRDLIAHKQSRGLSAVIVTIEDILEEYAGVDNPEKLRNFIRDAYTNWETEFVLLGGDVNIIPMRALYCYAAGYTDHIPSDLYYQCLDGSYNSDGDTQWGEPTDGPGGGDVDLMAEVYIGRAAAENAVEMSNFVYKTLAYENESEGASYLRGALMCGEHLGFGGISEYAKSSMEEIRLGADTHGYTTAGFASSPSFTVGTLYEEDMSWAKNDILSRINSNTFSIINHLGHANYDYVMKFNNADADALSNENFLFAYSQGCIPGNFEVDCVAEHLTTSTRHGMFSVVFNSRYGWGAGNSTDGPSQRFNRQFWDAYFAEGMFNIGALNADSHEDNIWDINGSCIRWCYYESNLLGDPHTIMRGQVTGPSLAYASHVVSDAAGGNDDGVCNPGETIDLLVSLANAGSDPAPGVTAVISSSDGYVSVIDNSASFGDIPCCGAVGQSLDSYRIGIDPSCPTPHALALELDITDANGESWSGRCSVSVYTSSQISGSVTAYTGSEPIAGATVSFSGPMSGETQTDASGNYLFGGIDGTYAITAHSGDFCESETQTITIPPDAANVDFRLRRPEISVLPADLVASAPVGDIITETVSIANAGDTTLEFTVAAVDAATLAVVSAHHYYDESHFVELEKGAADMRVGLPATLGAGGPDAFGYSWRDSDEPGGPAYVWNDISSSGTWLGSVSGCDDCFQQQAISFSFPFYGQEFTSIYVSSNGCVTLGAGNSSYNNYALPSSSAPSNLVAGLHDDLSTANAGDIYFQDFGSYAIVQFDGVGRYSGSGTYTYQIALHDDGRILYYYNNATGTVSSCTIGIQNETRDDGLTVVYNASYLHDELAIELQTRPRWLRVDTESGTLDPGQSIDIAVTMDAAELYGGVHEGLVRISHNDPRRTNPIGVPCTFTVDGVRRLAAAPASIDFGEVWQGDAGAESITLTNAGDEPTTVESFTFSAAEFSFEGEAPFTVGAFSDTTITIRFTPGAADDITGNLTIVSDAEDNPSLAVALSGTGIAPPEIAVGPLSFHEELDPAHTVSRTVLIENDGRDTLVYSIGIRQAPEGSEIQQAAGPAPAIDRGPTANDNTVVSDINETLASYTGTHLSFAISPYGEIMPFQYPVGTEHLMLGTYVSGWVLAYMTGGVDKLAFATCDEQLNVAPVSYTEVANSASYLEVAVILRTADNALEITRTFKWRKDEKAIRVENEIANIGAQHVTNVDWKSVADWDNDGDPGGDTFDYDPERHMIFVYQTHYTTIAADRAPDYLDLDGWSDYQRRLTDQNYTDGPVSFDGLETLHFELGDLAPGQTADLAAVYAGADTYTELVELVEETIDATDWLTVDSASGKVPPSSSAEIVVTFDATQMLAGMHRARLEIQHNAPGSPSPLIVPCTLSVSSYRRLSASPESHDFGVIRVGESAAMTLTLFNDGNEATTVAAVALDHTEFAHSASLPLTVPPMDSVDIPITFSPLDEGPDAITVEISSNAEDNPLLAIVLQGAGVIAPAIAVAPDAIAKTAPANAAVSATVAIENIGGEDLHYSASGYGGGSVIINEFCNHPDFIELWNRDGDIDLSGWRIEWADNTSSSGSFTFPSGYVLAAGKGVVLRESSGSVNDSTFYWGANIGWNENSVVSVALLDNEGGGVDFVRTGGSTTPPPAGTAWSGGVNFALYSAYRHCNEDGDSEADWNISSTPSEFALNPGQSEFSSWPAWLSAAPAEGTVVGGATHVVSLDMNATGLDVGQYETLMRISHNGQNRASPIEIPITFTVVESIPGVSRVVSIGSSASIRASGSVYSLGTIKIGSPAAGTIQGSKFTLIMH